MKTGKIATLTITLLVVPIFASTAYCFLGGADPSRNMGNYRSFSFYADRPGNSAAVWMQPGAAPPSPWDEFWFDNSGNFNLPGGLKTFGPVNIGNTYKTANNLGSLGSAGTILTGSPTVSGPTTLTTGQTLSGLGERNTIITATDTTDPILQTVNLGSTNSSPKAYGNRISDLELTGPSTGSYYGMSLTDLGATEIDRVLLGGLPNGIFSEAVVGGHYNAVEMGSVGNGWTFSGPSSLKANTITTISNSNISGATNGIVNTGDLWGLHINGTILEGITGQVLSNGSGSISNLSFDGDWFENNGNPIDLTNVVSTSFDNCYWSGNLEITNGNYVDVKNANIQGATQWPEVNITDTPFFDLSFDTSSGSGDWQTGSFGADVTLPIIGTVSTPDDRRNASGVTPSQLISTVGGPLVGWGQPATNMIQGPPGSGYWGSTATITSGQSDAFGGTTGVSITSSSGSAYTNTIVTTVAGDYYVFAVVLKANAPGAYVQLWANSSGGGTLNKRLGYYLPDTNWRIVHMVFKADYTTTALYIAVDTSGGVTVHRASCTLGAEMAPILPYGRTVSVPFKINQDRVTMQGTAAPTSGTWAVGDECLNTAPAEEGAAGSKYMVRGWLCTGAGTPGTWLPERVLTGN